MRQGALRCVLAVSALTRASNAMREQQAAATGDGLDVSPEQGQSRPALAFTQWSLSPEALHRAPQEITMTGEASAEINVAPPSDMEAGDLGAGALLHLNTTRSAGICNRVHFSLTNSTKGPKGYTICDEFLQKVRSNYGAPERLQDLLWESGFLPFTDHASEGAGRSGASFKMSIDGQYIMKTMTTEEKKIFKNMVDSYTSYMVKYKNKNLLIRILGLVRDHHEKYWMVMNNVMHTMQFDITYDLKGSKTGRDKIVTIGGGREVHKDLNWEQAGIRAMLTDQERDDVIQAIKRDTMFLARAELLDYSMVLGQMQFPVNKCGGMWEPYCIAPVCKEKPESKGEEWLRYFFNTGCYDVSYPQGATQKHWMAMREFYCSGSPGTSESKLKPLGHSLAADTCIAALAEGNDKVAFTCLGIIDLLKLWKLTAEMEHHLKGGGKDISVQPPGFYKERFSKFMEEKVLTPLPGSPHRVDFKPGADSCQYWGKHEQAEKDMWVPPYSGLTISVIGLVVLLVLMVISCCIVCLRSSEKKERAESDVMPRDIRGSFGLPPTHYQQPVQYPNMPAAQMQMQGQGVPMSQWGGNAPLPAAWQASLPDAKPHSY